MPDMASTRYVGHAYDNGRAPRTWHIDPDCGALAGREVSVLTSELQKKIEDFNSKLLRPCRLCNK